MISEIRKGSSRLVFFRLEKKRFILWLNFEMEQIDGWKDKKNYGGGGSKNEFKCF